MIWIRFKTSTASKPSCLSFGLIELIYFDWQAVSELLPVMQFFWREICFERDWFDKNCHFRSTYFYPAMKKSYARRRTSDCKRSCVKHSVPLCWSYLYTSFYLLLFLNSFLYLDTGLTKIANCPSTIILFRHSNMPSVKKCFTIVNYDFRVVLTRKLSVESSIVES